jgi:uncharacterized protein (TIGR02145 family)
MSIDAKVTDKDGNNYTTVEIEAQVWMAANLNVSHFRNGDIIPEARSADEWEKSGNEGRVAWCYYNNDPAMEAIYGKLYNWYAVNDSRGLAPEGWHVPSALEWTDLTNHLGYNKVGGSMKSTKLWISPNTGATNSCGFAGLPGGFRTDVGRFLNTGEVGYWWSSSENGAQSALFRSLDANMDELDYDGGNNGSGYSVRCVRD